MLSCSRRSSGGGVFPLNEALAQSISGCSGASNPWGSGANNQFTIGGNTVNVCDLEQNSGGYTHTLACHAEYVCVGGQAGDDLTMRFVYDTTTGKYAAHGDCDATTGAVEFCALIDDPYDWVETVHVYGTPIHDDISFYNSSTVYLRRGGPTLTARIYGDAGDDDLKGATTDVDVQELVGGAGRDFIDGNGATALYGGDDGDYLVGTNASETLYGGGGDDLLVGDVTNTSNNETMWGGDGDDTLCADRNFAYPVITASTAPTSWVLTCGTLDGGGSTMHGGSGDDVMYGGAGPDIIYGDGDDDTMFGYGGDDNIDARSGADYADGGNGADKFCTSGTGDEIHGGPERDTVWATIANQTFINSSSLDDPTSGTCGANGTGDQSNTTGGTLGGVECYISTSCPI